MHQIQLYSICPPNSIDTFVSIVKQIEYDESEETVDNQLIFSSRQLYLFSSLSFVFTLSLFLTVFIELLFRRHFYTLSRILLHSLCLLCLFVDVCAF